MLMVRAARSATAVRSHDIVGRAEQRAQLGRILDEVIDDGSRFVIMGGDAGAGKTTVVEVFVADLFGPLADRKAQVIRGQCVPMGGEGLPYAPIVGALRDLVTQHGRERIWSGPAPDGRRSVHSCPTWAQRRVRTMTPSGCDSMRSSPCCWSGPARTGRWW